MAAGLRNLAVSEPGLQRRLGTVLSFMTKQHLCRSPAHIQTLAHSSIAVLLSVFPRENKLCSCPNSSSLPLLGSLLHFCSSPSLSQPYPWLTLSALLVFAPSSHIASGQPSFLFNFIAQLVPTSLFPASQLVPISLPAGVPISCPALAFCPLLKTCQQTPFFSPAASELAGFCHPFTHLQS